MRFDTSYPSIDLHSPHDIRPAPSQPPLRQRVSLARVFFAGLAGTLVYSLATHALLLTPVPPGTGGLSQVTAAGLNGALKSFGWAWQVPAAFGPVGQELFHAATGLTVALIYALFAYPRLSGPGWLRGLIFCQIPWLLHAFVVLPWTGAGVLGLNLSPSTPLVCFLLNAVFGLTLGMIYRPRVI